MENYLASIGIVASEINRRDGTRKRRRRRIQRHPRYVRWKETIRRVVGGTSDQAGLIKSIRKSKG